MRIVSLVPSVTATIADLGLQQNLVGCTTFCIDPPGLARRITVVGGTKDPDIGKIKALAPDRILVNTEENRADDIAACRAIAPVLESFPRSPCDVPRMIREIAAFTGTTAAGDVMARRTESNLKQLEETAARHGKRTRFIYLIWRNPWMATGNDTYISRFLELAGYVNCVNAERYPRMTMGQLISAGPDVVFFSSEPWPFRNRDIEAFKAEWHAAAGPTQIPGLFKIDGKALSWHGSETERAASMLRLWILGEDAGDVIQPAGTSGR